MTFQTPNKRPTSPTPTMMREAAQRVATDLIKSGAFDVAETIDDLAADIVKAAGINWNIDGYELARELERRCHWSPDASMVEDLDMFSAVCQELLSTAEKQWAVENPMEPPFPIGAVIKTRFGTGMIDYISKHSPFTYGVTIPDRPKSFAMVRFEDARAA